MPALGFASGGDFANVGELLEDESRSWPCGSIRVAPARRKLPRKDLGDPLLCLSRFKCMGLVLEVFVCSGLSLSPMLQIVAFSVGVASTVPRSSCSVNSVPLDGGALS